jgi:hypothetical protein
MTTQTTLRCSLVAGLALLASSVPAVALGQVTATGDTVSVIAQQAGFIQRRPDTAYDSKSNVYLTVSANPNLRGRFVDGNGIPMGAPFDIDQRGATQQVPRVAFSPDAGANGAFLVTWLDYQQTDRSQIWGRLVAFNTGGAPAFVTNEFMISAANADVHPEMGAAVEYSTASKVFLTVYRDAPNFDLRGQRVANTGAKVGVEIAVTATPYWEAEPAIAYNPDRDEFMVAYFAEPSDKNGLVLTVPVRASDGALTRGPIAYAGGSFITVPQIAYDTLRKKYLAAHFAFRPGAVFEGRWLLADGTPDPALGIFPLATGYGSYDGFHLVRNTRTESYLGAFHGLDANDLAVEVSAAGTPTAPFRATFSCPTCSGANAGAGTGNFNPRIAASTNAPDWLMVTVRSFTETIGQRFVGKAINNGGGGGGTNGPADTRISIDIPAANSTHPQPFAIAGWALDAGAASGTGVNRVDIWAFPTGGGSPSYLGSPTYGTARPDVAAAFGSTRFTNSGYGGAIRSLTPGQYTFRTYAFSTVAGQFNNAAEVVATATANPMMFLDLPANVFSTTPGNSFVLAGWSMDTAAGSGTGIDTIHVWAFKDPDTTPVASFIGTATLGGARPDVQNAFGLSSQFANTGFSLTMSLPSAGQWAVIAYGHSSVTNTFVVGAVKRVTVR